MPIASREAYEDHKYIYIVTEVCLGGSLEHWADEMTGNLEFASRVAREVSGALAHCHAQGVCHRDLKLENILLVRKSSNSPMRIADFGLAKRCSKHVMTQRMSWAAVRSPTTSCGRMRSLSAARKPGGVRFVSVKGTPAFMAPEVIRVLHTQLSSKEDIGGTEPTFYDFKCDVWSVGVIVYTLLVGDRPFSLEEVSEYVAEGTPLPDLAQIQDVKAAEAIAPAMLESECPLLWEFVSKCLVPDFDKRLIRGVCMETFLSVSSYV